MRLLYAWSFIFSVGSIGFMRVGTFSLPGGFLLIIGTLELSMCVNISYIFPSISSIFSHQYLHHHVCQYIYFPIYIFTIDCIIVSTPTSVHTVWLIYQQADRARGQNGGSHWINCVKDWHGDDDDHEWSSAIRRWFWWLCEQ